MIQPLRTTTPRARMQLRVSIAMATVWLIQTNDQICDQDEVTGCQDDSACNYDATATDAGYCDYPETNYDCDGNCLEGFEYLCETAIPGCTDSNACNYNGQATEDNGSCSFPASGYDCSGVCLNDSDQDGICDEFEVEGCTDCDACNFNESATDNDGSCTFATSWLRLRWQLPSRLGQRSNL